MQFPLKIIYLNPANTPEMAKLSTPNLKPSSYLNSAYARMVERFNTENESSPIKCHHPDQALIEHV